MLTRRHFLSRGALGIAALAGTSLALPGDSGERSDALPDGSASKNMVTPEAERAIKNGLEYLAANRRGGAFGARGAYHGNVAISALAGLAFMSAGSQPERSKHGKVVSEALRFILDQENRSGQYPGFLHNPQTTPHGPMYGHGFATLFLGEVYGMVHDKPLRDELRDKLRLALGLIVKSQNNQGGWRYYPNSRDADLSVTVCQIVALRSGRNAGFAVPKATVDRCIRYVKDCQDPRLGSFSYMLRQFGGPHNAFARTGAGLSALFSAGVYSGPEIDAGLHFLMENAKPGRAGQFPGRADMQYFYGHYYAAQAMWTAGGRWWSDWFPAIRDELLGRQAADGSWDDQIDPHYATAMACIILQIPNNYLPILQK
jgi:hypothetical protein